MVQQALKQIKETEIRNTEAVHNAKQESIVMIKQARVKAERMIRDTKNRAQEQSTQVMKEEQDTAQLEIETIQKQTERARAKMTKEVNPRIKEAVALVIKRIIK